MQGLPPENIYGHTKKLSYILEQVERHRRVRGAPLRLLDFGCGNGAAVTKHLIRDGVDVYGVDVHQQSIDYAQQNFSGPHAHFSGSVPEGMQFDLIVYADVLEHLARPAALLREHRRMLRDDGAIIGAVPNGFGPFEIEKRIDRWLGLSALLKRLVRIKQTVFGSGAAERDRPPYNEDSGHLFFFTRKSLAAVLEEAGFGLTDFRNGAFLGAPLSALFLLRGERIAEFNARLADRLPARAVSTWYFTARKRVQHGAI